MIKNSQIDQTTKVFEPVNIYGAKIGKNCKIGTFVEIQKGVVIGNKCKISSHSFLCTGVKLGDGVFVGHGVMFTNDKHPESCNSDGTLKQESDYQLLETIVESGVSIGSNATILPGITIGSNAVVGAGSVVTKSVPSDTTVVGNPAKPI